MALKRLIVGIVIAGIVGTVTVVVIVSTTSRRQEGVDSRGGEMVFAEGIELASTATAAEQETILSLVATGRSAGGLAKLKIDYPLNESVFPPEMIPPTFLWRDFSARANRWLIAMALSGDSAHIFVVTEGRAPSAGEIDPKCIGPTNEAPKLTAYQASATSWTPSNEVWAACKAEADDGTTRVSIFGFSSSDPGRALSRGQMTLAVSKDPVAAPIFYRDVPLMPTKLERGVIKPLPNGALPLIAWRLRDISRHNSRVVLTGMPTCANCHSFSADGRTLAMDVDGPSGDKGAYAITRVATQTVIDAEDIITWNSFTGKPKDHKTIGFLSRISPDGQYVVSTVNESLYVVNFADYRFLQVFYPTRGILAYYSRKTGKITALDGADDADYVHCDPAWTPDGKWIVFARAEARDSYVEETELAAYANDPEETPMRYDLYRIPFNGGKGGVAEPVEGASANGMSNTFPKVSPDGKWIVFVKCRNGQLLRPDSRLWIVPAEGGKAREMRCNTPRMNSWHSFSPNGRWMVFSSKANTPYTQMFLTHMDEDGNDSPPVLIPNATAANRAVNIPEFVNIAYDELVSLSAPTVDYYRRFQRGNELLAEGDYEEAISHYRKALRAEPTSTRINNNLAICLTKTGQLDQAIKHWERALKTDPNFAEAHFNVGGALAAQGNIDQSVHHLRRALEIDPDREEAHCVLGALLTAQGQTDRAIEQYRKALELNPGYVAAHFNLGLALAAQGRTDQAIRHYREAVTIDPRHVAAHNSLGLALREEGKLGKAIEQYRKSIEIDPANAAAHFNLGVALTAQGKTHQALGHYRNVLKVKPEHIGACNALAWVLATSDDRGLRNGVEAIRLAQIACRATGYAESRCVDTLAAAYAEAGQWDQAIQTADKALRLARKEGNRKLAEGILARLRLYRRRKPFGLVPHPKQ